MREIPETAIALVFYLVTKQFIFFQQNFFMKKPLLFLVYLSFISSQLWAQTSKTDSVPTPKKKGKVSIIPMPVIAANPTTGLVYGIAPGASWKNGDPKTTSMSNFLGTLLYTAKKQLFTQVRGNMFLEGDSWILTTDFRYNLNSQPTYGLGSNPKDADKTIVGSNKPASDDLFNGPTENEM
ncbi:MAG: hypothetical protein RLZZ28_737, partial [Bacteroidota bacterium]